MFHFVLTNTQQFTRKHLQDCVKREHDTCIWLGRGCMGKCKNSRVLGTVWSTDMHWWSGLTSQVSLGESKFNITWFPPVHLLVEFSHALHVCRLVQMAICFLNQSFFLWHSHSQNLYLSIATQRCMKRCIEEFYYGGPHQQDRQPTKVSVLFYSPCET